MQTSEPTQATEPTKLSTREIFYSPASDDLVSARKNICSYSFPNAQQRLLSTKRIREDEGLQLEQDKSLYSLYKHCNDMIINSSQYGDDRPLTCIQYSPQENYIATGSLSCYAKIFDTTSMSCVSTIRHHYERVTDIRWHPQSSSNNLMAISSADSTCSIWNINSSEEKELSQSTANQIDTNDNNDADGAMNVDDDDHKDFSASIVDIKNKVNESEHQLNSKLCRVLKGHQVSDPI
jgi:WD40 repeat protein